MSQWQEAEEHVDRAREFYELGRWEEAEAELRKALSINPREPDWHFNLGLTLESASRFDEAVDEFSLAHDLEPDNAQPLICLGMNLNRLNRPAEALDALRKAQKVEPNEEGTYCPQIESLGMLGQYEEAEQVFYMARLVRDECPICYRNLGETLLQRRDFARAVWCFKEASRLDPRMRRIHALLATAYAMQKQYEQAYRLYLRDLREDPGNIQTLLELGELLVVMARLPEASEKFRRILELEPANPDAHFRLGCLAVEAQAYGQARVEFELVTKLDPEYPGVPRQLASVMVNSGQPERARRHLQLVLETLSDTEPDLPGLAELLVRVGMNADARSALQRHLAMNPEDAESWHHLATVEFILGDISAGIVSGRRALRLDSDHDRAMHNLVLAYLQTGQSVRAAVLLRRAQKAHPHDASIRRLAARVRFRLVAGWFRRVMRRVRSRFGPTTREDAPVGI